MRRQENVLKEYGKGRVNLQKLRASRTCTLRACCCYTRAGSVKAYADLLSGLYAKPKAEAVHFFSTTSTSFRRNFTQMLRFFRWQSSRFACRDEGRTNRALDTSGASRACSCIPMGQVGLDVLGAPPWATCSQIWAYQVSVIPEYSDVSHRHIDSLTV